MPRESDWKKHLNGLTLVVDLQEGIVSLTDSKGVAEKREFSQLPNITRTVVHNPITLGGDELVEIQYNGDARNPDVVSAYERDFAMFGDFFRDTGLPDIFYRQAFKTDNNLALHVMIQKPAKVRVKDYSNEGQQTA